MSKEKWYQASTEELRALARRRKGELGDAGHAADVSTKHLETPLHAPVDAYVDRSYVETKPHAPNAAPAQPDIQPQPISETTVLAAAGPAVQLTVIEDMERLVAAQSAVSDSFSLRSEARDTDGDGYRDFIAPTPSDEQELVNA